jgi:hypothetical protein
MSSTHSPRTVGHGEGVLVRTVMGVCALALAMVWLAWISMQQPTPWIETEHTTLTDAVGIVTVSPRSVAVGMTTPTQPH